MGPQSALPKWLKRLVGYQLHLGSVLACSFMRHRTTCQLFFVEPVRFLHGSPMCTAVNSGRRRERSCVEARPEHSHAKIKMNGSSNQGALTEVYVSAENHQNQHFRASAAPAFFSFRISGALNIPMSMTALRIARLLVGKECVTVATCKSRFGSLRLLLTHYMRRRKFSTATLLVPFSASLHSASVRRSLR
jgi:hypothetical protein